MFSVSVVLPTYNERDNVAELIAGIRAGGLPDAEIMVVDDSSPDGTAEVVAQVARSDPRVRLIQRRERGLTSAIQRGVNESHGEVVMWMDCDLTMSPATMLLLLKEIEFGADVAIGSRYAPGGENARRSKLLIGLSVIINQTARLLLGGPVRDFTTGFVAARKSVLDQITLRGDYGEYCIDFLTRAMRKQFRVVEVPWVCQERAQGESKTAQSCWDLIRHGRHYLATVARLTLWRR